ncbi:MAG: CBS domain-containing protein [Candidatus Hydrothermarchaeaceae archaeon]
MALKDLQAKDVMIKDLITIGPNEKIALADLIMTRNNIGALPVVENSKIVGIITQRDIMFARNYDIGGLMAKDLMSRELITVDENTLIKNVLVLMLDHKIERLPVVRDGKLVGLIVHDRILRSIYQTL